MFRIMVLLIGLAWASLLLVSWGGTAQFQSTVKSVNLERGRY